MKIKIFFLSIGLFFLSQHLSAQELERIINFDVVINVNKDRSLDVKEYIHVYAKGVDIKRGITRSLPSSRQMDHGSLSMNYDILEITKDGVSEPYFTEYQGNKRMIYIGEESVFLDAGKYTYMIHYTIDNQIVFFKDYDEIYWNAIGSDVQFNVENASCKVRLPSGAKIIQESAYLGSYANKDKAYDVTSSDSLLDYRLKKSLEPYEGFTVAIGFEKGFVDEPSFWGRYGTTIVIGFGLLFLIPYYVYTWWRYGRDPETPEAAMEHKSPNHLSPASINYILKEGGKSNRGFTASIISLAVKGYLKIEEYEQSSIFGSSNNYILESLKEPDESLPGEEIIILDKLFAGSNKVVIDGTYDSYVKSAMNLHRSNLDAQHRKFVKEGNNLRFIVLPIIVSVVIGIMGFIAFVSSPYTYSVNMVHLLIFAVVAFLGIFFYTYLIKQPTIDKLVLQSRIKGFKMYIGLIDDFEKGSNELPDATSDNFEDILPYAFALGIEDKWTNKFKSILEKLNYKPSWNNGVQPYLFYNSFGNDFSNRSHSSSIKPSESGSGSSGSGSGGGGGGGGVGGW
jgi:uncharacterized membrane protein YgcG